MKTNHLMNLFLIFSLGFSTFACSALKEVQKQAGLRTKRITLADLGPNYQQYKDTEFNYFSKKATSSRLKITYQHFKFESFDKFNKQATVLFAKFKLAQQVNKGFNQHVEALLNNEFKGESRKSLRTAMQNKSVAQLDSVERIGQSYDALQLSITALKDLVVDAKALVDQSTELVSSSKTEAMAKPDKAILADRMVVESKRTLERLNTVINGVPKLIKSMGKNLNISEAAKAVKEL